MTNNSQRDTLLVRGAREHNLKDVDLEIPRDALVVFTGLSGSGKSSLAFDTIYAEGQRRYVESLSAYARQFLGQLDKPDVDFIEGLSPAISIDQKSTSRNPRSTVGTTTEIYDYLRLLYARIGKPHCPSCGQPIQRQTAEQIIDQIEQLEEGTRFQVLAPVVRGRKGQYDRLLNDLATRGYARARITSGTAEPLVVDLAAPPELARYEQHTIEVVIDRLVAKPGIRRRLADSIETALQLAEGIAAVEIVPRPGSDEQAELLTFSEHLACAACGLSFDQLAPRNFSFNTPYGACETCDGLGTRLEVDPDLVIGDESLSLLDGVIMPWSTGSQSNYYDQLLSAVAERLGFDPATPWRRISAADRRVLLYGFSTQPRGGQLRGGQGRAGQGKGGRGGSRAEDRVTVRYTNRFGRARRYEATFEGVIPHLLRRHAESESETVRQRIEEYMREVPCSACQGARLRPLVLGVKVAGRNIAEVCALSVAEVGAFFDRLDLDRRDAMIAEQVLKEIRARLTFLLDVGLDYLTLDRAAGTLAGGEAQRIRLATQIGSGLVGCLYVLDEPSIGLHQRDNERLIETLIRLRDLGNTVIVVEHDHATIEAADHIVDIGPGAGEHGGEIVSSGTLAQLMRNPRSITGQYLAGKREIAVPAQRRRAERKAPALVVRGAREHNLQRIDVRFPLGLFTAVTGVSGSGKSSLVNDILHAGLTRHIYGSRVVPGRHTRMDGLDLVDKVVGIDQSPIGRTPRSNPATYTGVFDHIRRLFASTQEARVRGYLPGRFSFNVKGGRCEACSGDGTIKIDMQFLPDIYVPCEVCKGRRYNRETLEVHYKGKTISEVLDMSVEEARGFFANIPAIARHMETLDDVGLGYVRLGQPATTLSGGEAQRVKLASELRKRATGQTVYILDEPTTGLHFEDVNKLLTVLHRLVDKGNTVIVIEHDLDVIKTADHIIDLGPEGGSGGGRIVAEGTPEHVATVPGSYTGKFLTTLLAPQQAAG